MTSAWLSALPALVVAAAILVLPGIGVAWLAGFRGLMLPAASAAVSAGTIALASIVAPILGIPWSLLPVIAMALVLTIIAAVLMWLARRSGCDVVRFGAETNRPWAWAVFGVVGLVWIGVVVVGIGGPGHPAQHFDAIFHLNAVRFVMDTGSASPFDMTMSYPQREHLTYPTLWHAVVSLVVPAAGGDVVVATNIVSIAVIAVVWPLAASFLTAAAWRRMLPSVLALLLTLCFGLFPLGFLNWGALYPNLLGNALVPVLLGLVLMVTRGRALGVGVAQAVLLACVILTVVGGVGVAHPSSLLAALLLSWPLILEFVVSQWRTRARRRLLVTVGFTFGTVLLVGVWPQLNVSTGEWKRYESLAQALGEVTYLGPVERPPALLLATLVIVGCCVAVRRRNWGLAAAQLLAAGFFVIAAWFPIEAVRSAFVGVWYDDVVRVGALLVLAAIPLAALGAAWTVDEVRRRRREATLGKGVVAVAIVILVPLLLGQFLVVRHELHYMRSQSFVFDETSQGLTPDEAAMFEKVADIVPDGSVVAGDPLTAAGLLYAYTGQPVLFPHMRGDFGVDASILATELRHGGPAVCEAADRAGVEYVLDFGRQAIYPEGRATWRGLHSLDRSDFVEQVATSGDAAALYRITGCD